MSECVICPSCEGMLEVPERFLGREVVCGGCSQRFVAEREGDGAAEWVAADVFAEGVNALLAAKKRWDRVDNELRALRDMCKVEGRIPAQHKAEMIMKMEAGGRLLRIIRRDYPQYAVRAPLGSRIGWFFSILLKLLKLVVFGGIVAVFISCWRGCS